MHLDTRDFGGFSFWLVGPLEIQRTANGQLKEYVHPLPEGVRPNRYSAGPFCKFGLPAAPNAAGVYAVVVGEELRYIGECADLVARFSSTGYGLISARNCHEDGQSTNCKLNSRVLAEAKRGYIAQVWFHSTEDRKAVEALLITNLTPIWNGRGAPVESRARVASKRRKYMPAADVEALSESRGKSVRERVAIPREPRTQSGAVTYDFRQTLLDRFAAAEREGVTSLLVKAGDLHREVGGYPGLKHRMPSCCAALRGAMQPGDQFIYVPPKGNGASLTIEYRLPRGN